MLVSLYAAVLGLCYTEAALHLHFLKHKYGRNLQLPAEERPLSSHIQQAAVNYGTHSSHALLSIRNIS
jgi:hypothetical protein